MREVLANLGWGFGGWRGRGFGIVRSRSGWLWEWNREGFVWIHICVDRLVVLHLIVVSSNVESAILPMVCKKHNLYVVPASNLLLSTEACIRLSFLRMQRLNIRALYIIIMSS